MTVAGLARVVACVLAIAIILGSSAVSAACLKANTDDQAAHGRLKYVTITTEAYARTEHAYILELREPACLEGADDYDKVETTKRIHVFAMEKPLLAQLHRWVGKNVIVHGNAFGEHTAHHHAPIVMRIGKIDRL
jgi:hypothetical protein